MARPVFDRHFSRPESEGVHRLHLEPDRGARLGEYSTRNPAEYTDSYYGPGDRFGQREFGSHAYERAAYGGPRSESPVVGGVTRRTQPSGPTDEGHYGEVRSGGRSWADVSVSSAKRGPGRHHGRGPKGYARSDERLTEVICELLAEDPHVDASHVRVEVNEAVVTLTGHVEDRWTKYQVEELIEQCVGVKDIDNQIRVPRADTPVRS